MDITQVFGTDEEWYADPVEALRASVIGQRFTYTANGGPCWEVGQTMTLELEGGLFLVATINDVDGDFHEGTVTDVHG